MNNLFARMMTRNLHLYSVTKQSRNDTLRNL